MHREAGLAVRGRALLREAVALTGPLADVVAPAADDPAGFDGPLAVLVGVLRDHLPEADRPTETALLLAETYALRAEIREWLGGERLRRRDALEAGLARLRKVSDPDELLARACEAVVESCGFDRVMLSRVEGSLWRPWKSFAVSNRDPERAFREWIRTLPEIRLDTLVLETEMVRRREPALVADPRHDPRVHQPLLQASRANSYVAAPLMPTGRVIGFLHADHESRPATTLDRDILGAFADAFGRIFERAVLLRRLREQREQVREAMRTVETVLADLADAEIDLADQAQAALRPARTPARSSATLESLLTSRELEVLALMATGATNNRIADELVIAEGTVKSHVKRILRKLCVDNRAEAISQYLRLTIGDSTF
ncbi:LuxR C-terminal-related transcriptional regulator [Amycolatopsis acidiphila]|uniref:GAF domain-containing protein n=1 Tax=Amycolatopsis acidiphila TaxID=715473 RepID=A0A558ALZ4_9PSEU|nr:LuxR C-terminal-related transcriptional regulator [Amycolatopsis acidiphila]TVT25297.1 GAF domain-containing protein [Amycolatopsis acidiphila]UIJ62420.1 LuxR C-terminal-related transcriptional regulator [Amycolatopsis acidiphila]GHG83591.1 LuxR family transcriptional regulator [Amycolatopsis acidiphila]